jgi:type II pantothenate kinase
MKCREALHSSMLKVVCSGSDMPVIDLSVVSMELAMECEGVDLIILEGMGRYGIIAECSDICKYS